MIDTDDTRLNLRADVGEQANWWVVQLDLYGDDLHVRAEFDEWLSADITHAAAYARADSFWDDMALAAQDNVDDFTKDYVPVKQGRGLYFPTRMTSYFAGLAALVLILASGIFPSPASLMADHANTRHLRDVVSLPDGSVVTLARGSAIDVQYSASRREIRLLQGSAYFDVKPNSQRPFVVRANDVTAEAIGTAYEVSREDERVSVTVREGIVGFGNTKNVLRLTAGEAAVYEPQAPGVMRAEFAENSLAWLDGHLVIRNRPVQEVLAQLEVFSGGLVLLLNDDVAAQKISGRFNMDDPVQTIEDIATLLDLDPVLMTASLIILK